MASKLLLITVFILNVIAFGLAVAAEQRRSSVSSVFPFFLSHNVGFYWKSFSGFVQYVFFGDILCLDAEKMQENVGN